MSQEIKYGTLEPLTILIVENDPTSKTLLLQLLSKSSLPISEVKSAETLQSAFELLDRINFSVVLLDLNLPDSKGLDTLVGISQRHPQAAIVVITGEYNEDFGLKALTCGAQEHLIKGNYNTSTLNKSIYYAIERKKTDNKLQLTEEKYRTIFENSAIAITMADEQERLISWNKFTETLLGMDKEDLYFKPVSSLYPAWEWEKIRSHNVRQKGMQHHLETKMIKKDGKVIDIDVSLSVLKNAEGKTTGSIGVFRDITERKDAEEKLKETMEKKSQFISTVSHELRTPLASIKEGVSIILDGVLGEINSKQRNFLNIAKRNADRLARLINDVLDFQKLEAGKMGLNIQLNSIKEVIEDVHKAMSPSAENKGVALNLQLEDNLPNASFDSDKIIQVLTNLISNAIKFTPEKGRIYVNVRHKNEELILSVKDTGMGIPKEALPKIFERFYRVQRPGKQIQGTGLGLAIVNKIVMMHDGRIEAESEVDKGTTFTVSLPLAAKSAPEVLPEKMDELVENTVAQQSNS